MQRVLLVEAEAIFLEVCPQAGLIPGMGETILASKCAMVICKDIPVAIDMVDVFRQSSVAPREIAKEAIKINAKSFMVTDR